MLQCTKDEEWCDVLRSDLRGASVVTTPGTPGGVRGTRHQHNGSEEAGAMGKYPGIVSLYLTQLWSMNDHYDVMTLKIEQSGNMRTEYLCQIIIYSRVTSNWMSKGFIPFWQRRYCRIKIPSQWVIIIQTLNSVREDLTFDSQQTVCTEVFILSQCLIDLQVSIDS